MLLTGYRVTMLDDSESGEYRSSPNLKYYRKGKVVFITSGSTQINR